MLHSTMLKHAIASSKGTTLCMVAWFIIKGLQ